MNAEAEQTSLQMQTLVDARERIKVAIAQLATLERRSRRTDTRIVAGREVAFTWSVSYFDPNGMLRFEHDALVRAEVRRILPEHLAGTTQTHAQIETLARLIENHLRNLCPPQKWPDTLAEVGIPAAVTITWLRAVC